MNALLSCAKNPSRSPSLFCQPTYNMENRLRSSYVNPTTASLWMVNFFGAVLNKGNLFLGKVGPMPVALGSEPASPQRTVGISLDLLFQPSLLQRNCFIFIFPYI